MNTYGYVGGNPLSYADPYGLCTGQFGLPCGYGVWRDVKREAPLVRDAMIEGTTNGLTAISMFYGAGFLPKAARAYGLLSEAAVLSDASIAAGFGIRNAAITTYEATACAANKTIAASAALASTPTLQNNQQNILDFINSLFPGSPSPNIFGASGAYFGNKYNPEEFAR